MKKIFFCLLFAVIATTATQAQVQFETKSTDAVREMAVAQKKLVFIDLYATWCGPCKAMERDVFSDKSVGEFMHKHFVSAKYDVDQTTGRELIKKYGNGSVPTYLIFDTEGNLLGRLVGGSSIETFIKNVQGILEKNKK